MFVAFKLVEKMNMTWFMNKVLGFSKAKIKNRACNVKTYWELAHLEHIRVYSSSSKSTCQVELHSCVMLTILIGKLCTSKREHYSYCYIYQEVSCEGIINRQNKVFHQERHSYNLKHPQQLTKNKWATNFHFSNISTDIYLLTVRVDVDLGGLSPHELWQAALEHLIPKISKDKS